MSTNCMSEPTIGAALQRINAANQTANQDGREANTHHNRLRGRPGMAVVFEENGAGEAIRTPDPNLGKVVLYP